MVDNYSSYLSHWFPSYLRYTLASMSMKQLLKYILHCVKKVLEVLKVDPPNIDQTLR